MARNRRILGACPHCGGKSYTCSYNLFQAEGLRIDSWEHKCPDCGRRETQAFRSDADDLAEGLDPEVCPFCARRPD